MPTACRKKAAPMHVLTVLPILTFPKINPILFAIGPFPLI